MGLEQGLLSNKIISDMLRMVGFTVMAAHAQFEQNIAILRNYMKLIEIEARRKNNWVVLNVIEYLKTR